MRSDGAELLRIRNDIIASVFYEDQLDVLSSVGTVPVYVLLTGGSSAVPIVRELATGELMLRDARFRFAAVDQLPDWIGLLPRDAAQQLADVYPQCAVAIGGSVPTYQPNCVTWKFRDADASGKAHTAAQSNHWHVSSASERSCSSSLSTSVA